jgi:hypothetical protein
MKSENVELNIYGGLKTDDFLKKLGIDPSEVREMTESLNVPYDSSEIDNSEDSDEDDE